MSWQRWFNVSGGAAALRSTITAIARNPNHLDLFVTGTDGNIYSTWWDINGGWANWFHVAGGRGSSNGGEVGGEDWRCDISRSAAGQWPIKTKTVTSERLLFKWLTRSTARLSHSPLLGSASV